DTSVPLALRAIELEPTVSGHRWSAAALYLTLRQFDKARAEAQNALKLARTSEEQRAANDLLASIDAARTAASADEARAREAADAEKQATEANARVTACNGGDAAACTALVPSLESRCGDKEAGACGMLGWLYENGRGVTADATQAVKWYRLSCDSGEPRGCMAFALMQAHGQGVPKDVSAALELLDKICTGSLPQACTQEGVLLASRQKATDLARIRSLLDAGCKGGDTPACDLLKSLPYRQ
ncbi:MAG TPA: tetratricopeptide repeat protein, partial [Vicinamibacterales bacterium]|nr:tetratricopeptide repeat protein [Vicinamibacterales bacterium]